jgi:hypothetical protein
MNNFFRIFLFTLIIGIQFGFAQTSSESLWSNVDEAQIVTIGERHIVPQLYRTIKLDFEEMQNFLLEAPLEFSYETRSKLVVLYLPMPDGSQQRFSIVESPIMAPELAAKYPEIRTYMGKGIDDP